MTKAFNVCIVCCQPIEFFGPDDWCLRGATTFAGTPGYGSRFDGIPGVPMQVIVCDDCLEKNRERVAVVRRTRQRDIFEYFEWEPTEEDGIRKPGVLVCDECQVEFTDDEVGREGLRGHTCQ